MSFLLSLFIAAAGAILIWAVHAEVQGIDLAAVGVILLIVGLVGALVSLLFADSIRSRFRRERVYDDDLTP